MRENEMPKKINLLFVIPSLSVGGTEREVLNVVNNLDKNKFRIHLALFEGKGKFLKFVDDDIQVHSFNRQNWLSFFLIIPQLAWFIFQKKPEVVIQFTSNYSGFVSLSANFLSGNKAEVIISVRNLISKKMKEDNEPLIFFKKWLIETFYPFSNCLVGNSKAIARDLTNNFGLESKLFRLIPSSIELEKIKKCAEEEVNHPVFEESKPALISVGRLMPQKNIELMLQAFKLIVEDIDLNLVIIGDGPMAPHLKNLAQDLEIQDNIAFLGYKMNPWKYMGKADIFLITSKFEGLPHTILEAMACGLPVVSTNFSGVNDFIEDQKEGLVVESYKPRIIAEQVKQLLNNSEKINHLAENCREKVKTFDIQNRIKDYEDIFQETVNR